MLRRLRVLLAWAVVLWGAGMAVPPCLAAETALYAPRIEAARRAVQAVPAGRPTAAPVSKRPPALASTILLPKAPDLAGLLPLYLIHQTLLL